MDNMQQLILELIKLPKENEWVEFKINNSDPEMIGKDISALSNAAALIGKQYAYMIWGVDNETHEIVGTDFDYGLARKGSEELENWLRCLLSDNADYNVYHTSIGDKRLEILIISRSTERTVMFEKQEYIRIGSYTKKLNDYPLIKAHLWDRLRNAKFEEFISQSNLQLSDALKAIDYSSYYDLLSKPTPSTDEGIAHDLIQEALLKRQDSGLFSITNLGAILFAKELKQFPTVSRKAVRVVQYKGISRLQMLKEQTGVKGYAAGFDGLIQYIQALLPSQEIIEGALRRTVHVYPPLAIRESVANALIHQDFSIAGTGPLIELFDDRVEITNPGQPLVDVVRIIDTPPRSRNEKLAALMRRLNVCEELGTGWDKITISCESAQLPSPRIDIYDDNMKVTFYAYIPFHLLSVESKLWACYWHACINYVEGKQMSNSSLRARFGLDENQNSTISRLIKEAVHKQLIKAVDPNTAPRYMKYIPFWA